MVENHSKRTAAFAKPSGWRQTFYEAGWNSKIFLVEEERFRKVSDTKVLYIDILRYERM